MHLLRQWLQLPPRNQFRCWSSVPLAGFILFSLNLRAENAPSFVKDVAPIFEANCAGCHAENVKMGSLSLDTYAAVMKGGNHGSVVTPGKSSESRLYLMITGKMSPAMPLSGKSLAAGDTDVIRRWIEGGAQPPAPGEEKAIVRKPSIPDIKPRLPVKPEITALAYRPDGKVLALGGFKEVRLVEPGGKVLAKLPGHAEEVRAVAFSPDGKFLAAAGGQPAVRGEVKIWDVESRSEIRTLQGHSDCIYATAFSPDGKILATASYDKLIKLWDVASGKELRTLKNHIEAIYALAFTPDGTRLLSGAADRTVKVWDTASGERLFTLGEPLDGLNTLAVDPSGKRVAAGGLDKTIRIWELGPKGGKLVNSLIAHEDAILKLAWSPDGKWLVSTSADKTIKVFQASDLTEVKLIPDQPDWVYGLEFAPDGKSFAAGRFDGSLTIYPTPGLGSKSSDKVASR